MNENNIRFSFTHAVAKCKLPLFVVLFSLPLSFALLAADSPPTGWDWPVSGQLWIKCVVDTNTNGNLASVLSVSTGSSNLYLPPAQLAFRYKPGGTKWSNPDAWELPILSFSAWRFQVVDREGAMLADKSESSPLRVPVAGMWTDLMSTGPSEGTVAVDVLPLAIEKIDAGLSGLRPLLNAFLLAHPTSLSITGNLKFHILIPVGANVQVEQNVTVETLIVGGGALVYALPGKQVTVRNLLHNHGTISGVVGPQVDWLQTTLEVAGAPDRTARTDAHMRNWYDDRELIRLESLKYSSLLTVSQLPPMVEDKPDRWLRRVANLTSTEQQPSIMLLAGQFMGDMPGTYWARWGRYAKSAESEDDPARLRLDLDTRFISRAITNQQITGQFIDSTVPTKFVGTLESEGSIEVENPLELRGPLVNHGTIRIRRALIAPGDKPEEFRYNTGWLHCQGPALSVLGGSIFLEHESASMEFGDQTKVVAENLQISGQGTINAPFLDGEVYLGQPGDSFTLLGKLEHGRMRMGPSVKIELTEDGFYNGGLLDVTGTGTRIGTPGYLGPNNHDLRTTIGGRGKIWVHDGAILEFIAGFHQPDYWRRWSVVVENDIELSFDSTLHTAPFTGVSGSSDSPVEILGTLMNQGQIFLDRTLEVSGRMENTGKIQATGASLILKGDNTSSLGGKLLLDQANIRTTGNSTIAANELRVEGNGAFDASISSGMITLEGTNSAFNLTPRLSPEASLLVNTGTRCLVPESGLFNDGLIDLSGSGTLLWTPNWLGAANHDMRTTISGRGVLLVRDGAVLELTAGFHRPDYWRQWSVVIENDVVVGSGGTLHTLAYTGFGGSDDSPVEIRGALINRGQIILNRTLLVSGRLENYGKLQVDAPLITTNRVVNKGQLVLNATLSSPDIASEGGSIVANQVTVGPSERLSGNVTITGNLLNNGIVSPGTSPGLIEIAGNYTQTGELVAEVHGQVDQAFDRLIAGGQVQLGGRLRVVALPGAGFQAGAVFDIVKGVVISGTFETVIQPLLYDAPLFEVSYGSNYVRLTALQAAPPMPVLVIPFQTPSDVRKNGFRLQVSNLVGPLTLEFSTNLLNWQPVMTLTNGSGPLELLMSQATNSPMGFYRGLQSQ